MLGKSMIYAGNLCKRRERNLTGIINPFFIPQHPLSLAEEALSPTTTEIRFPPLRLSGVLLGRTAIHNH
jgi:hypothetical protein